MPAEAQLHLSQPIALRVRFRGVLDASWFDNLHDVALTSTLRGLAVETTLVAVAPDEAALLGVLNLLHQLGHSLISVKCSDKAPR
jgi:hypothetical protein